jgi:hypothetical protein
MTGWLSNGMLICKKSDQSSKLELNCESSCGAPTQQKTHEKEARYDYEMTNSCTDLQLNFEQVYRQDRDELCIVKKKEVPGIEILNSIALNSIREVSNPSFVARSDGPPITILQHFRTTILLI